MKQAPKAFTDGEKTHNNHYLEERIMVVQRCLHVAECILGLRRHIRRLEGILPTGSYCKKIRDEESHWQPIEEYIAQRSEAEFSHTFATSKDPYKEVDLYG